VVKLMRPGITIAILFAFVIQASGERTPRLSVEAWSSTNGPYGDLWHLSIQADDSPEVSTSSGLGAELRERHFTVSSVQREAILKATEEAQFFALPESVGPSSVPIHGPDNTLEVELDGRAHKVFLNEPDSAKGQQVERFRRVWRAVVETVPLKPPL
jgi:hypothetical protein